MKRNERGNSTNGLLLLLAVVSLLAFALTIISLKERDDSRHQLKRWQRIVQAAQADNAKSRDQLKAANDKIAQLQAQIAATPSCPVVAAPKVEAPAPVRWETLPNGQILITNVPEKGDRP